MCVGKCTRILGPCLIALGVLSIAANVLLLFPSWMWSYLKEGHITKQAMQVPGVWGGGIIVLLAATQITAVGWRCGRSSDCRTCRNSLSLRAQNYLYDQSLWNSVCIEPPNVVAWNIYFFSVLLVISVVEMVLASLQIINGFFGCLCGLCEGK
ncbi:Transmembrane 4 L6 family member 1 [Chelonia mydas]|uniref:Transmembrane 4 L6 family member 1 n=1 Tax=Chelonia mydas TaxID=8469 RepID=M7ATE7_CHEMY|nr:Transmembrane 4 L6 family member 1 [Chelonia mydas]